MSQVRTGCGTRTLPKRVRVRKRRDFLAIQGSAHHLTTRHFMILHRAGSAANARLGITVTKKIGNAVIRNQIKRAVRETFRQRRGGLPALDLVVVARKGAGRLATTQVAEELGPAMEEAARRLSS